MKFTWEPKDIEAGRIICKNFIPDGHLDEYPAKDGWRAKWTYKIGWLAAGNPKMEYQIPSNLNRKERDDFLDINRADWCLIAMTDGMIGSPKTKQEICDELNKDDMIPCRKEWFIDTMAALNQFYS